MINPIPLSLYIHIPWCVKKCPYCDFNSHVLKKEENHEAEYIDTLIADFLESLDAIQGRQLHSIFLGGGTPSLFKPESYERLFNVIFQNIPTEKNMEITLEGNPGTVDMNYFKGYREIGINRLSLGVQSFEPSKLKQLGRIHSSEQAKNAFYMAREVGFDNINIDLMFGLPGQTLEEALIDIEQAIQLNPEHLSWYQLTLEPNTVFYKRPPKLPDEEKLWEIEVEGKKIIEQHYQQYEISAYNKPNQHSRHNLNYWLFGDYIGIGAGAHGKITVVDENTFKIFRSQKKRQPADYMNDKKTKAAQISEVSPEETLFEFMLNALRLYQPISYRLLMERTALHEGEYQDKMMQAVKKGLIITAETNFQVTSLGHQYLNNLQEIFLFENI